MVTNRYPATCWLTPSAEVRPSPVEGLGLFATAEIDPGDLVMRLGGQVIDDVTLAGLTPPYSSLTVEEGVHLLLDPGHPVRYGNHSCDPNLWHDDSTTVVARRRVMPGEELSLDYATHSGTDTWAMPCRCLSPLCRGTVTGGDWRLARLRRAYGTHWVTPLLRRIAQSEPGALR
ncbi:SET domain-containing protein-lysine N-methyltransferase [Nonomuraea sp. NPDC003804]|uniref:SET domain-containing protein n=1 Tax=Nonomuraea sp. NPDC003804 TaxID=3154547 RepID=UPI0033B0AD9B